VLSSLLISWFFRKWCGLCRTLRLLY